MSWHSLYGTGATIFDVQPEPEGRVRFTVWLSVFFVPLIPVSSWSAIYVGESIAATERTYFQDLIRVPHERRRLLRTFILAVLGLLATVAPLAFMIRATTGRAVTDAETTMMLGLVLLASGLVIGAEMRRNKKLRLSQAASTESKDSARPTTGPTHRVS